jgi:hypothetical protein
MGSSASWRSGVQLAGVLGHNLFDGVERVGERDGDEGRHVAAPNFERSRGDLDLEKFGAKLELVYIMRSVCNR